MAIATELERAVNLMLEGYVNSASANLCAILVPVAVTGISIYVILMGYAIMRGEARDPLHSTLWKLVKIAFVLTAALSVGVYQGSVLNAFYGIQEGLIGAFSTASSVGAVIDDFMAPYDALANEIGQEASTGVVPDLSLYIALGIVIVAQVFIFAVGIGLYLISKVALAMVMALGPVFILCAMFPATQKFTESWIAQVLNYVILSVLVVAGFTLLTTFAQQFADQASQNFRNNSDVLKDTVYLLIVSIALSVVMLNLNVIASGLAGGATLGLSHHGGGSGGLLMALGGALAKGAAKVFGPGKSGGQIAPSGGQREARSLPLYRQNVIQHLK